MKYFAAVTKNEEALRVVLWKSTQVNLYVKKVKEDTEFWNDYLLYRKGQESEYKLTFIYISIKRTLKRYPWGREKGPKLGFSLVFDSCEYTTIQK